MSQIKTVFEIWQMIKDDDNAMAVVLMLLDFLIARDGRDTEETGEFIKNALVSAEAMFGRSTPPA